MIKQVQIYTCSWTVSFLQAKILIFPEGTRNSSGKFWHLSKTRIIKNQIVFTETLLPFKKGSFHVAIEAQCIIQPIVVSRYFFLDSKRKFFGRGHSLIKILPEISTKGISKNDLPELLSNVQNIMQEEFERLNDEVAARKNMKDVWKTFSK